MKTDLLSARTVQAVKPASKNYQLTNEAALYLRVRKTGAKVGLIRKTLRAAQAHTPETKVSGSQSRDPANIFYCDDCP